MGDRHDRNYKGSHHAGQILLYFFRHSRLRESSVFVVSLIANTLKRHWIPPQKPAE
jgi:hypothetical protein